MLSDSEEGAMIIMEVLVVLLIEERSGVFSFFFFFSLERGKEGESEEEFWGRKGEGNGLYIVGEGGERKGGLMLFVN